MKIADIEKMKEGQKVELKGWIYRQRASKNVAFIVLRDSTGIIQIVYGKEVGNKIFEKASTILIESSIKIKGIIKKDARAPSGFEIEGTDFEIINKAERFPITKDQSTEFLLNMRHLWIRSQKLTNVFKIKDTLFYAARDYLRKDGWYETQSPMITACAGEGGSTLFKMDYFGHKAYLAQTGQLYSEALIFALEKVYCFAPSFRAEKSKTRKHLTEYWHLEPEGAWITHEQNMKIQEGLISYICQTVAKKYPKELLALGRDPKDLLLVKPPFKRITYEEAIKQLQKRGSKIKYGEDFGVAEEKLLMKGEKAPMFVERWPAEMKAFYMKRDPKDKKIVLCDDLFAPEGYGEIIGASERETDNSILIKMLKKEGANLDDYKWYLELRKFGSVPHSGFGVGMERVLSWICKLDHIRDAIPFPRLTNRFYP